MPYKNVHYIKLMLELFDDRRFIKDCNDSQKLDYILWLAMAGLTQNDAENNPEWFKTRFNLSKNIEEIAKNTEFLSKTFPKMVSINGKVKFKNFKKLHNPIRSAEGTPKDSPKNAQNINIIRIEYIRIKGWKQEDFTPDDYARTGKAIKTLLIKSKGNKDLVINALTWASRQSWCDWTLETIIKRWPDFMKERYKLAYKPKSDPNCNICQGAGRIPDGELKGATCMCVR